MLIIVSVRCHLNRKFAISGKLKRFRRSIRLINNANSTFAKRIIEIQTVNISYDFRSKTVAQLHRVIQNYCFSQKFASTISRSFQARARIRGILTRIRSAKSHAESSCRRKLTLKWFTYLIIPFFGMGAQLLPCLWYLTLQALLRTDRRLTITCSPVRYYKITNRR